MHIITKEFRFEAAHRLLGHPKCGRLHGHSYRVVVELQSHLLTDGMVRDYAELSRIKEYIDNRLDHRYLVSRELVDAGEMYERVSPDENAYLAVQRTTAEHIAEFLFYEFWGLYPELSAVTVCETASTTATFRRE